MNEKPLHQEFFDEPQRFDFFQAVRLLERLYPERAPLGRDSLPAREIVQFRTRASLEFPASEIYDLRETQDEFKDERRLEMFVNFMGMLGANGALPPHITELVIERARYRDTALWNFLDLFTHRFVSLFFRAWEKYRFPLAYERGENDFTEFLFDFLGLGTRGLRGKLDLPDESLIPYGGIISNKPRSVSAIRQTLSDYFGVSINIEQFSGQWLQLDDESITRLGAANSQLGVSAIAGARVFDHQSKFRVRVGAVGFEKFKAFLPNGSAYKAATGLIKFLAGDEFDFDVQLVLLSKEVPSAILTTRAKRRPMLGWSSFLKTQKFTRDDEQVILQTH